MARDGTQSREKKKAIALHRIRYTLGCYQNNLVSELVSGKAVKNAILRPLIQFVEDLFDNNEHNAADLILQEESMIYSTEDTHRNLL